MNTDAIDKAFTALLKEKSVYKKLGETDNYIKQLRYKLKNGIGVSMELKLRLLQKSGWRQPDETFSRADLVSLLKFNNRASQATRDLGPEYVIEKWEKK